TRLFWRFKFFQIFVDHALQLLVGEIIEQHRLWVEHHIRPQPAHAHAVSCFQLDRRRVLVAVDLLDSFFEPLVEAGGAAVTVAILAEADDDASAFGGSWGSVHLILAILTADFIASMIDITHVPSPDDYFHPTAVAKRTNPLAVTRRPANLAQ